MTFIEPAHQVAELDLDVRGALTGATQRIAPLWPLERWVAVNPYFGLADLPFVEAAERLAAVAGVRSTLPVTSYLTMIAEGRISRDDIEAALALHPDAAGSVDALIATAEAEADGDESAAWAVAVPTVAQVASDLTGIDWEHLMVDRITAWAAAHFDEGQAIWKSADRGAPLYAAWREEAEIDRTPEVMGLRGFRSQVRALPTDAIAAADVALAELGVPAARVEEYLHALLLRVGGFAAHARRLVFENDLYGRDDDRAVEFAAVLLSWELAIWRSLASDALGEAWSTALAQAPPPGSQRPSARCRVVLQEAFDRSEQRRLIGLLAGRSTGTGAQRPAAQAVFCIDVRSEVLRRHLEAVDPTVDTIGFAGFFGFPVEYVPLAHNAGEAQLPVLLTPTCSVPEAAGDAEHTEAAAEHRRRTHHVRRAWKSFKMGAISCFSFVGPVGLIYLPKLFTDGYAKTRTVPRPDHEGLTADVVATKAPDLSDLDLETKVALAGGALRAMSLRHGLAPLVLVTGHGATTVNNPYGTGLDCGACGGHTGEVNARIAVSILNDPQVRSGLAERGTVVPDDTWFVAGQHDTTTDRVTIFDRSSIPASHLEALGSLEASLDVAGSRTRSERSTRMGLDAATPIDADIARRAADWAEVRPEWGLAGCRAFVVAPRDCTSGTDLGGRSFLHSYDWTQDEDFSVLELIMTAPMVVASWISLQYYASSVDNEHLGSGNKVLHNVVGRIGVLEGNGGDLRVGLPWQSVHDGTQLQHEALRLNVVIAAPTGAMDRVIESHDHVRHLLDHGWINLFAMDDHGRISHRYAGRLQWDTP